MITVVFLMQDTGSLYGAERATLELAQALQDTGRIKAEFLLIREDRLGLSGSTLVDAITSAGLPHTLLNTSKRLSRKLACDIADHVASKRDAVVHTVGYKANLHGVWAAKGVRFPVVYAVHGWLFRRDLKERFYGWIDIRAMKRVSKVVALSEYYLRYLTTRGVPKSKLCCIPSGLNRDALRPLRESTNDRFTIGMLGRLSEEKGHKDFIDAMATLRSRGVAVRGLIAGDGDQKSRIEGMLRRRGLSEDIELRSFMNRSEFLSKIDVLCVCSRIENRPFSIMEAMAMGVPVVATAVGGIPELIQEGITGRLIESGDRHGMANVLAELERDPSLRKQLANAAKGYAE